MGSQPIGEHSFRDSGSHPNVIRSAVEFVRRQIWAIVPCLILGILAGIAYNFLDKPHFTASATMLIDPRKGGVQHQSVLGDTPSDETWITSEIGILMLERPGIGQTVAKKLKLANDSDFGGVAEAPLLTSLRPVVNLFGHRTEERINKSENELTQIAAGIVAGELDVKRIGLSYLVSINFTAASPDRAVGVANAAADAFVEADLHQKFDTLRQASEWLLARYKTLHEQASEADRAVVEFKTGHKIVTAGGKLIDDQQLLEVSNRLVEARALVADNSAKVDRIQTVLKEQEATGKVESIVSEELKDSIIIRLQGEYLDLVNKEADWAKRFGPNHLAVVNLRNKANDIRKSIHEELTRIAQADKSDLEIAKNNEQELEKQLQKIVSQIPSNAQITLRSLENSADSYRTFYNNFLTNYTDTVQQETSPIPRTAIVSYATWAYPSNTPISRILFIALLGGLGLGIGMGVLREMLDRSIRTPEQIRNLLQANCITLIPQVKRQHSMYRPAVGRRSGFADSGVETFDLVTKSPFSRFAESIRALKLAADLSGDGNTTSPKVIGFTSSLPREGKSTIAAALAIFAAHGGARVILVDCDLRKPALSRVFFRNRPGIAECLRGGISLEQAIITDAATGLAFLPAGDTRLLTETTQIFASDEIKILFETLRLKYDYVIVDLSPLAPVVDVRATARLFDFYIFIVEWGRTTSEVVSHALEDASGVQKNLLGIVLNKVNMNVLSRYETYHQYFQSKYFSKYGYSD